MWLIYVICIIFTLWALYVIFFSYKLKKQTINFFGGGLGSSKTLNVTKASIKDRNKSLLLKYLFSWNLGKLSKFRNKYEDRTIYSNYPILIKGKYSKVQKTNKKIGELKKELEKNPTDENIKNEIEQLQKYARENFKFSHPLKKGHLLGKIRVEEHAILALDEVQIMFPMQRNRSNPEIIWNMTFLRHFVNPTVYMASQSIGNVDISIRRVVNVVYNFSSFQKLIPIVGLYKVDVDKINYMEDVVVNTNDISKDNNLTMYGIFGKKRYDSRYMRRFYNPTIEDPIEHEDTKLGKFIDKLFRIKKEKEEDIFKGLNDDDNVKEVINNSFITKNFDFIEFDIDPLDDYVSFKEFKESFYNSK